MRRIAGIVGEMRPAPPTASADLLALHALPTRCAGTMKVKRTRRSDMRTLRALPLLGLALTSVAGCGDGDAGGSTPAAGAAIHGDVTRCGSLEPVEPGHHERTHTHAGIEQVYWVVVPDSYEVDTAADLYIVVPGGSGSARAAVSGWAPGLVGLEALVVFPDVAGAGTKTVPMIRALIDDVAGHYCVNNSRVYATGTSASAGFTARLMAEASDVFAAFAPGIGAFGISGLEPLGPVPFIAWSGDPDRGQVERSVAQWSASNGCETDPTISRLGSGISHHHYEGCDAPSEYYFFAGMGHQVPAHDCSAVGPRYCAEYDEFDFWDEVGAFFDANALSAS